MNDPLVQSLFSHHSASKSTQMADEFNCSRRGHEVSPTYDIATLFSGRLAGPMVEWCIDARVSLRALVEVERLQVDEVNVPASKSQVSSAKLR